MGKRSWTEKQLKEAVVNSRSIRQILRGLGLKEAGGNYRQIKKYLKMYKISTEHLKGKGWSKGAKGIRRPQISLRKILIKNSSFQSFKLKKRLIADGLMEPKCQECGWSEKSKDGRLPLELDHINGDSHDNRLENLRILCPNCHSLKPTHRGSNTKK